MTLRNAEGIRRALNYVADGIVKFRIDDAARFRVGGPFHVDLLLDLVEHRLVVAHVVGTTVIAARAGIAFSALPAPDA